MVRQLCGRTEIGPPQQADEKTENGGQQMSDMLLLTAQVIADEGGDQATEVKRLGSNSIS